MAKMSEKDLKITSLIFFLFFLVLRKIYFRICHFEMSTQRRKVCGNLTCFQSPLTPPTSFVNWIKLRETPELNWKNYFVVCYTNKDGPSLKQNRSFLGIQREGGMFDLSYFDCQKIINKYSIMNVTHKIKISIFPRWIMNIFINLT